MLVIMMKGCELTVENEPEEWIEGIESRSGDLEEE
jgi:formylmethanofuran dehydrogenase subunit C